MEIFIWYSLSYHIFVVSATRDTRENKVIETRDLSF